MLLQPFFDSVRGSLFSGKLTHDQVDGMQETYTACTRELLELDEIAYTLASEYHETGRRMQPVREGYGRSDAESYMMVTAYNRRNRKRNYAAIDKQTGQSYYGRGKVQITHKRNYQMASDKLGHDFVNNPDDVMLPHFASIIIVRGMNEAWFTKFKLSDFDLPKQFHQARQIVNGFDKASKIAVYADKFSRALQATTVA